MSKNQKIQVVAIHGGDFRESYTAVRKRLRTEKVTADSFKKPNKKWRDLLQQNLGDSYEVFNPRMPLKDNAAYAEWKIWFEKLIPFLKDNVILIGHSLGGIFLAKYFSENTFPKKALGLLFVAPPFWQSKNRGTRGARNTFGGFVLGKNLSRIEKQVDHIYFYQSINDPLVDMKNLEKYKANLPHATERIFTDRGHFWDSREFPEILKDIRDIARVI